MNFFRRRSTVVGILCILYSCSDSGTEKRFYYENHNARDFTDKVTLKEVGEKAFPLDANSGFYNYAMELFYDKDSSRNFAFLNQNNHTIYIYDYDRSILKRKIQFETAGPNDIGKTEDMGFHILGNKNIVLVDHWLGKLLVTDSNGVVLKRIDVKPPSKSSYYSLYPKISSNMPPICLYDSVIYIFGEHTDNIKMFDSTRSIIKVDLSTYKVQWLLPFTDTYKGSYWGMATNQFQVNGCYVPQSKRFVINFAADPLLKETDLDKYAKDRYLGSKYFEEIEPLFRHPKPDINKDLVNESRKYKLTTPSFRYIYFDPFHKLFYRKAYIPFPKDEYAKRETEDLLQSVKHSFIIADENFNKVGEVILDKDIYDINMIFFTKEGLNVAKLSSYNKNEDSLHFALLKPFPEL